VSEDDVASLLLCLELRLIDPDFRRDRARVATLLAEDFREFGSSGHEWSRERILDLLATETAQPAPSVRDFACQLLTPDLALVTYLTERTAQTTLRSSLWRRDEAGWKVVFHQGTRAPKQ
jgi:hypothetical protein